MTRASVASDIRRVSTRGCRAVFRLSGPDWPLIAEEPACVCAQAFLTSANFEQLGVILYSPVIHPAQTFFHRIEERAPFCWSVRNRDSQAAADVAGDCAHDRACGIRRECRRVHIELLPVV